MGVYVLVKNVWFIFMYFFGRVFRYFLDIYT